MASERAPRAPRAAQTPRAIAGDSVDLDLDVLRPVLAEARGEATTVRLDGKVIHIEHASGWSSKAMEAAIRGDWATWADEVIEDDDEFDTWTDANLKNEEIEAVFEACGTAAKVDAGKSRRSSRRSRGSATT